MGASYALLDGGRLLADASEHRRCFVPHAFNAAAELGRNTRREHGIGGICGFHPHRQLPQSGSMGLAPMGHGFDDVFKVKNGTAQTEVVPVQVPPCYCRVIREFSLQGPRALFDRFTGRFERKARPQLPDPLAIRTPDLPARLPEAIRNRRQSPQITGNGRAELG
jgi:hypothetical protein